MPQLPQPLFFLRRVGLLRAPCSERAQRRNRGRRGGARTAMTTAPSAAGNTKHAAVKATMLPREARVEATTRRHVADFSNSQDWRGRAGARQARRGHAHRTHETATSPRPKQAGSAAPRVRHAPCGAASAPWRRERAARAGQAPHAARRCWLAACASALLSASGAASPRRARVLCATGRVTAAREGERVRGGCTRHRLAGLGRHVTAAKLAARSLALRCSPRSAPCGRAPPAAARGRIILRARCVTPQPHRATRLRAQASQRRAAARARAARWRSQRRTAARARACRRCAASRPRQRLRPVGAPPPAACPSWAASRCWAPCCPRRWSRWRGPSARSSCSPALRRRRTPTRSCPSSRSARSGA